jgi:hypothetical protein
VNSYDSKRTIENIEVIVDDLQTTATSLTVLQTDLHATARTIGEIETAISTAFVGQWPDFVTEIVETIEGAKSTIVILCDHPTYGIFSVPDKFDKYIETLRTKAVHIPVQMMWLETELRKRLRRDQFGSIVKPHWDLWRDKNKENIVRLLDRRQKFFPNSPSIDTKSISRPELVSVLDEMDLFFMENFLRDVDKLPEVTFTTPIYFWIADGLRAVVALVPAGPSAREIAFRTSDPNLIEALQGIWSRFANSAPTPNPSQDAISDVGEASAP